MPSLLVVRPSAEPGREEGLATPEARGDLATTFCAESPGKALVCTESSTPDVSFMALERCAPTPACPHAPRTERRRMFSRPGPRHAEHPCVIRS